MPRFLYQWHHQLSDKFAPWARERVNSDRATELSLNNISGTEWPIFSAVFYLWTTEALQDAWEENPLLNPTMPKEYAREAIESAAAIISDPNHANWVRIHWGDDYLHQENLFYRMLLISGLTSYQKLLGDDRYETLLVDQIESLSAELDASPYGLLDDYPGQCYPIDILPAIAAIQRADEVLGTDHTQFTARAIHAFEGTRLDAQTQLPAYIANSKTGEGIGPARGVGISYMLIWAPELWPDTAQSWFERYENHFWQEGLFITGVREFSKQSNFSDWLIDVDAGPVVGGYGTVATAFGIGAARVNGRFDQAYPLSAEGLVASWPLPNGTLLGARTLSNLSDAPYIGESILLFNLTRQPIPEGFVPANSSLPIVVYLILFLYLLAGLASISFALRYIKRWRTQLPGQPFSQLRLQFIGWAVLILASIVAIIFYQPILGLFTLLMAQLLPRGYRNRTFRPSSA
ncbi:hypothetical protein [Candidatus Leptofilum sp.]|uniref:hypothetical protein n=1 Tax=Candidatus Leptofilum sp. TaxID=3241576 RepID=UPI003B59AAD0